MQVNKITLAQKRIRSQMDDSQIKELIKSRKSNRKVLSNEKIKLKKSNLKHSAFDKKDIINCF